MASPEASWWSRRRSPIPRLSRSLSRSSSREVHLVRMPAPTPLRGLPKLLFLLAAAGAMTIPSAAQSPPAASAKSGTTAAVKAWTPLKTSWGDPDLQGMWPGTDLLGTPLQRDPKLGTRALLTDDEYAQRQARAKLVGDEAKELPVATVGSPIWWLEHGRPTRQASLIVEPLDGRIPPLT